jgi:hypothetical protein
MQRGRGAGHAVALPDDLAQTFELLEAHGASVARHITLLI